METVKSGWAKAVDSWQQEGTHTHTHNDRKAAASAATIS